MNDQDPETPPVDQALSPPPNDNRRRLRELLATPERDRTDEQWDEIIELEIQLAPGNRASASDPASGSGHGGGQKQQLGQPKKHRPRTNSNNRRPRPSKPTGNPV
ncbi:MAG TPA: hypothetical protein PK225_00040 [Azonexus sp.]|jgi:hypothetical protein|nr:hypothetical protein [Azonexus sp.]